MKPRQVPCFIITARATSSSPLEAYSTVVRRKQVFIVSLDRAEQGREPREHYRSPAAGRFAAPGIGLPAPAGRRLAWRAHAWAQLPFPGWALLQLAQPFSMVKRRLADIA